MMNTSRIEELIEPLLGQESAELVDLVLAKEGPRWVLRAYIDKPGGISLEDCAYFSERISSLLEAKNALDSAYVLEVSSPGIDRALKKEKDFIRFAGRHARVQLKEPVEGRRNYAGIIQGCASGTLALDCAGVPFSFPVSSIAEARLDEASRLVI